MEMEIMFNFNVWIIAFSTILAVFKICKWNKIKNTRRVFEEVGCHTFFDEDLCESIEHIC